MGRVLDDGRTARRGWTRRYRGDEEKVILQGWEVGDGWDRWAAGRLGEEMRRHGGFERFERFSRLERHEGFEGCRRLVRHERRGGCDGCRGWRDLRDSAGTGDARGAGDGGICGTGVGLAGCGWGGGDTGCEAAGWGGGDTGCEAAGWGDCDVAGDGGCWCGSWVGIVRWWDCEMVGWRKLRRL